MPTRKIAASHFGKDILDFFACLNRHAVEYLLVGGEAVIFYGYPRVTGDVDVYYRLTRDNVRRLYDALSDFWGGRIPGIREPSSLEQDGIIVQFGAPPNRIDLINRIDGVSFDEALADAVKVAAEGRRAPTTLRIIGLDALIRNKRAAGRAKDLDDLRFLDAARKRIERRKRASGTKQVLRAVATAALWLAGARGGIAAEATAANQDKPPETPPAAADETVVLDDTTLWRQFQVAGASHRRDATGRLVRCEIHGWSPDAVAQGRLRVGNITGVKLSEGSKSALWSPPPPSDWAGPAFDDSVWPRAWLPQPAVWFRGDGANAGRDVFGRSNRPYDPVVVLARGKFEVKDPAQVRACVLSLDYWGGVAVYVNGKEVARGHLSNDATNPDLVADDYPPEAWTAPDGKALKLDDEKNADRLALRVRRLRDVKIPASLLRKGVNVVAIEVHAAPLGASEWMKEGKSRLFEEAAWPPIGLLSARLTVSPAGAAVANVLRPRGVQVWNRDVSDTVTPFDYGDPAEPLRPITINAGRNTVFSGRLVVGSDQPIKG